MVGRKSCLSSICLLHQICCKRCFGLSFLLAAVCDYLFWRKLCETNITSHKALYHSCVIKLVSQCWLAASLLKHDIDKKDSLTLAKLYLNFNSTEEEATDVYSELWRHFLIIYKMDCVLRNII